MIDRPVRVLCESTDTGCFGHGNIFGLIIVIDGAEIEADIIIGADGIHSAVRESLFGPIEPNFTGCICWRGLVPIEAVTNVDYAQDMTAWWGPHGHIVHYPVRRGELVNFVAHLNSDGWTEES